jgi:outer membrane protein assembly factor BamE
MRKLLILVSSIATLFLSGCSSDPIVNRLPFVYSISIQQGNVITQDLVDQLRVGMTRRQVQFILGSPLLTDPFHAQRWDYVYLFEPGSDSNVKASEQHLTLLFNDDKVASISGTLEPKPHAEAVQPAQQLTVVVPPQDRDGAGILTRLWRWMGFGDQG